MDFNKLSLILFGVSAIFYFLMAYAILSKPVIWKFFIVLIAWVAQQSAYIGYGIYTDQIGFVLIGFFEILMVLFLFILSGKVIRDNNKS